MYYRNYRRSRKNEMTFKEEERGYEERSPKEDILLNMKNQLEWVKRQLEYVRCETMHKDTPRSLKKGEVYEFDWGLNVRHEFSNRHYGVVLADSDCQNPLVLVCPLKTNHGEIHPSSDVLLGKMEGIEDERETIAVINQIRSLDKLRLYVRPIIQGEFSTKCLFQLSNAQMKKIMDGIANYLLRES